MIRMNGLFANLLPSLRASIEGMSLESKLTKLVDGGIVAVDNSFLIRELANVTTNVTKESFPDKTGYECFINHIHIEDYITGNLTAQAVIFAASMLRKWIEEKFKGHLVAIISSDEGSTTVRFHHKRPNELWLAYDLDGYEQAVFEISSSDLSFFELLSFHQRTEP
jgi:hypothetical protein